MNGKLSNLAHTTFGQRKAMMLIFALLAALFLPRFGFATSKPTSTSKTEELRSALGPPSDTRCALGAAPDGGLQVLDGASGAHTAGENLAGPARAAKLKR
jgi:hypothetical protein